jgi:hypothetical protein
MTSPALPITDAPLLDAAFATVQATVASGTLPCAVLAIADRTT